MNQSTNHSINNQSINQPTNQSIKSVYFRQDVLEHYNKDNTEMYSKT